jgi:hypothetical protein
MSKAEATKLLSESLRQDDAHKKPKRNVWCDSWKDLAGCECDCGRFFGFQNANWKQIY